MVSLSSYRSILARPGNLRFSLTGLVARLPISMTGLGIVLLVQTATDSYGVAGAVAAAFAIANAAFAIVMGRFVDRLGQGVVLASASVVYGVSMVALVAGVEADWPIGLTYVAAACAGAALPPIGSCVRARWSYVLRQPAEVQTAFALEAVLDEVVFIIGPILVAVLATNISPVLGLGVAIVAGVGGSLGFAAQRSTEPPPHPHDRSTGVREPMPWRTVVPLAVVCLALGILFGAAEVTTVAFADEQGHKGWAGGLLAIWALGSLVAGVVSGAVASRSGPAARVRWGAFGMACAMSPLYFVDSIPVMAALLLVGGVAIAPTMIATLSLTERTVPVSRLTEGMAIMHTGIVAGVAPGATISGFVVDHSGASAAYLVSLSAGIVAALAAQAVPRADVPDRDQVDPPVAVQ
ncbi:MFS transporter [Nocardioides sp.]|uniref:MFS transporter n=1 Tax=Nocardioides sp. TaxID=35761 RepID=UPI001A2B06C6|nr:MFS transporter [Nocardioides sp.]MBJ7357715.1 MFS transporter [Nocardioides sp.]